MKPETLFKILGINDALDLPDAVWKVLDSPLEERNAKYAELLEANDYDLSRDWFQEIYEEELAQRKKNKQDFTPPETSTIMNMIVGLGPGTIHEPTAGTGGLIINAWHHRQRRRLPWALDNRPSRNMITCWELSDRSIPLLLLNLSIRGIMGYVYHGDILEQTVKAKYIVLNMTDDALGFSDVIRANANDSIKEMKL